MSQYGRWLASQMHSRGLRHECVRRAALPWSEVTVKGASPSRPGKAAQRCSLPQGTQIGRYCRVSIQGMDIDRLYKLQHVIQTTSQELDSLRMRLNQIAAESSSWMNPGADVLRTTLSVAEPSLVDLRQMLDHAATQIRRDVDTQRQAPW